MIVLHTSPGLYHWRKTQDIYRSLRSLYNQLCLVMMLHAFRTYLLLFFLNCCSLYAQETRIPFHLSEDNNLILQAVLNGEDTLNLMLHTATSELSLTEAAVSRVKSLHFDGTDEHIKSWGGSENSARYSAYNRLQIGTLQWDSVSVWEDLQSGTGTDGKLGLDRFRGKTVELDFDRQLLIVHDSLPAVCATYDKLPLRQQGDMLFVKASLSGGSSSWKNEFLLHSGYSGALLLDDSFVSTSNIGTKLKVLSEQKLTDAYGHVLKVKKAKLPMLQLGRYPLADVPAGFFEGAIGRQKMSVLGGDLLKRFHLFIDAGRTFIYLSPGGLTGLPYKS